MIRIRHRFRSNRWNSRIYFDNLCSRFAPLYVAALALQPAQITAADFGKQDMRGSPSITLFDERHCVPHQRHFASYPEMAAYMTGFIDAAEVQS